MKAWRTRMAAVLLAVILGGIYLASLARGPVYGDGLEFASVVHVLGIPHPTGYPLYVLLGKLWSFLPIGSVGMALNLFSAVCGVAAALLLFGAVREAMTEEGSLEDEPRLQHWQHVVIPAATALAWGLTPAVWQSANVAEVYSLFAVFFHGLIWLMLRNLRRPLRGGDALTALLFALALTHHRLIGVLAPAIAAYFGARLLRLRRAEPVAGVRRWAASCAVAFVIGLLPILYLPIRAGMNPVINWGDPSSLDRLLHVLRGGDFMQTWLLASEGVPWRGSEIWRQIGARLDLCLRVLAGEFVPLPMRSQALAKGLVGVLLAVMALGWLRCGRALRWSIPATAMLGFLVVAVYNIPDFQSFMIPLVTIGWFLIANGLVGLERLLPRRPAAFSPLVLGLLALWSALGFWGVCDRSEDERADTWARGVLESVEPNALLLSRADGDTYALWYAQRVDGIRPDVTVFGTQFMWSPWYRSFFSERERTALHFEATEGLPDWAYYTMALVGGVMAPHWSEGRPIYSCFDPYASRGDEIARVWPRLYGRNGLQLAFLGHTRDHERAASKVGPPDNPLLPAGWVQAMRHLGEPFPQLYRVGAEPRLVALARQRYEEYVEPGFAAWRARRAEFLADPRARRRRRRRGPRQRRSAPEPRVRRSVRRPPPRAAAEGW